MAGQTIPSPDFNTSVAPREMTDRTKVEPSTPENSEKEFPIHRRANHWLAAGFAADSSTSTCIHMGANACVTGPLNPNDDSLSGDAPVWRRPIRHRRGPNRRKYPQDEC